jgi:hypothetical protein
MERSPKSIRTKIVRVMKSYKKANDRFNGSDHGLEGIDYTNFHEQVLKETCRFYDDLKPVLGDRPNVTPWVTNEDMDEDNDSINEDDESIEYDSEEIEVVDKNGEPEAQESSTSIQKCTRVSNTSVSNIDVVDMATSSMTDSTKSTTTVLSSSRERVDKKLLVVLQENRVLHHTR